MPFQLQAYLDVTARRQEAAAGELQRLRAARQRAEDQLAQLLGYRREYRTGLDASLAQGIGATRLRDVLRFLEKLDRAIEQQTSEVERARAGWEEGNRRWLALRREQRALEVLAERHWAREELMRVRREQREHDEFALRRLRQAPDGQPPG